MNRFLKSSALFSRLSCSMSNSVQPQTPALELQIKVACYMAVLKWEPRVTLSSVTTERSFDGRMTVTLTGQHNDTGQPLSLTIPVS
ncbi:baseplate assembly protein [Escherichia coli]|nr:baseplate assembly protein [Escherichia coli]MBC0455676.1 baseplate assembly protein [Escherichia coli]